jgi:hypothetical protein
MMKDPLFLQRNGGFFVLDALRLCAVSSEKSGQHERKKTHGRTSHSAGGADPQCPCPQPQEH